MPNPDENLDRLLRAVRASESSEHAGEFAFETRVLARLREDRSSGFFTWAWRLAPFFGVLAVAAGLWSRSSAAAVDSVGSLLAEASQGREEATLVSFFTGTP